MKLQTILIRLSFCLILLFFISCKKDTTTPQIPQNTNGAITVKYEVISTIPFTTNPSIKNSISYANNNFSGAMVNPSGKVWTKEFTTFPPEEDTKIYLNGEIELDGLDGVVTLKIYLNGIVVAKETKKSTKLTEKTSYVSSSLLYLFQNPL